MKNFSVEFSEAKKILQNAQRIVIMSHRAPDGDTVGANVAFKRALKEQWGKHVTSACVDLPPENSRFLAGADEFVKDFNPEEFDVLAAVDCGAYYMPRFHEKYPEIFQKTKPFINIDHHASNDFFGTVNIVDPDATSATQVLYYFLKFCEFHIDRSIATALLHGLYFDSGSFMHSNTTPETLRIAADLLLKGADFKTIVKKQFKTNPVPQLKLLGRVFDRIHVTPKRLTRSFITRQDFQETGASPEDSSGAIDYLNAIPDGKFCVVITEDKNGLLKGSFRTRTERIDLSRLAGLLGGGGHKKAAGFSIPGIIQLSESDNNTLKILVRRI